MGSGHVLGSGLWPSVPPSPRAAVLLGMPQIFGLMLGLKGLGTYEVLGSKKWIK